ncbi:DUF4003 family protein [Terrilactibacillus laevilacticus]|uniref:DUF4003 family protein n=1 Tax=Terrilactibacillus laevilacticus TaxID=1380157 RepID=A0ABW5PM93_9BACI|nr:DUF4003 family protein [Terrilactibacillus laevilacticus]
MDSELTLFKENMVQLKKHFRGMHKHVRAIIACQYTTKNELIDIHKFRQYDAKIKHSLGFFNRLSKDIRHCLVSLFMFIPDGESKLVQIKENYDRLTREKLPKSQQTYLATAFLSYKDEKEQGPFVHRVCSIYRALKEKHPILLGAEDIPFCMLLAESSYDLVTMMSVISETNPVLKKHGYRKASERHRLTFLLVSMSSHSNLSHVVDKCIHYHDAIELEIGRVKPTQYTTIGLLASLDHQIETNDIRSYYSSFLKQKSYLPQIRKEFHFPIAMNLFLISQMKNMPTINPILLTLAQVIIRLQSSHQITATTSTTG